MATGGYALQSSDGGFEAEAQNLDTSNTPVGLWYLNGGLTDSSGNGHTLTVEVGSANYCSTPIRGSSGLYCNNDVTLVVEHSDFEVSGDVTFGCLYRPRTDGYYQLIGCGQGSNIEANNTQWSVWQQTSGTLEYFHEYDAGVNQTYVPSMKIEMNQWYMIHVRRSSDVIQFYINGQPWGAASGTLTTPTGGTSAKLRIGGYVGGNNKAVGTIAQCAFYNSALTDAQILALAKQVMPICL